MFAHRDNTTRVRHDRPERACLVCGGHTRGCSTTNDGAVRCRIGSLNSDAWKCVYLPAADGFGLYRRLLVPTTGDQPAKPAMPAPSRAKSTRPANWAKRVATYTARMSDTYARRLADHLGLPVECVAALEVGFICGGPGGVTYSFPEYDGIGAVCGISTRLVPHDPGPAVKKCLTGSRRGLTLTRDWRQRTEARRVLFIVEGPTDVLAMSAAGLPVVGRPSNTGGVKGLAVLLAGLPDDTELVFVGERDQKEDGRWPGLDGPRASASELAGRLGRPIRVTLSPAGHKDSREYIAARLRDGGADLTEIGGEFERLLLSSPECTLVRPAVPVPGAADDAPCRFELIASDKFASGDYRPEWLIQHVLVRGQPGTVAGPSKSLKTSLLVDAAVSLAAGSPFLNHEPFAVPHRRRVVIASGESGMSTLQETANRVCRSKGLDLGSLGRSLHWLFTLPVLSDMRSVLELAKVLVGVQADVILLDPFYLCLGLVDATNMMEVGNVLRLVAETLAKAGITLILAHHANRKLPAVQPMELTHLAFAGLEQFARQFLLLNRRTKYRSDGHHELLMRVGGSAGHGGLYDLDVEEGVMDARFGGRCWTPTVREAREAAAQGAAEREVKAGQKAAADMQHEQARVLRAIDGIVDATRPAATLNAICESAGMGRVKVERAVAGLMDDGKLVEQAVEVKSGRGGKTVTKRPAYRRPDADGGIDPSAIQRVNPAGQPVSLFDPPD